MSKTNFVSGDTFAPLGMTVKAFSWRPYKGSSARRAVRGFISRHFQIRHVERSRNIALIFKAMATLRQAQGDVIKECPLVFLSFRAKSRNLHLMMRFLRFVRFAHFGRNDKRRVSVSLSFRPPKGGVNPLIQSGLRIGGYTPPSRCSVVGMTVNKQAFQITSC